jgi:CheY-like chemotaxis protein
MFSAVRSKPFKVLMVEDTMIVAKALRFLLEKRECEVIVVESGEEALKVLDDSFDCVLMDLGLPGISGMETIERIRDGQSQNPDVRIYILTAHEASEAEAEEPELKEKIKALRITGFFTKPLSSEDLNKILKHM